MSVKSCILILLRIAKYWPSLIWVLLMLFNIDKNFNLQKFKWINTSIRSPWIYILHMYVCTSTFGAYIKAQFYSWKRYWPKSVAADQYTFYRPWNIRIVEIIKKPKSKWARFKHLHTIVTKSFVKLEPKHCNVSHQRIEREMSVRILSQLQWFVVVGYCDFIYFNAKKFKLRIRSIYVWWVWKRVYIHK